MTSFSIDPLSQYCCTHNPNMYFQVGTQSIKENRVRIYQKAQNRYKSARVAILKGVPNEESGWHEQR